MRKQSADFRGDLVDVSGLSLHDLDDLDESAFAQAMRDLLDPERRDGEAIAGFTSYTDASTDAD